MNGEGYKDPTAEKAMGRMKHIPMHIWEPIKLVKEVLGFAKLELVGISIRDRRSGRKYEWKK